MQSGNDYRQVVRITQVDSTKSFISFSCGVDDMDSFIHKELQLSVRNGFCRLYRVTMDGSVVALFALTFDSLYLDYEDKQDLMQLSNINIGRYYSETFWNKHHYPALEISYFAVAKSMHHRGLGAFLIETISHKAATQSFAGCQFLTVEALINRQTSYNAVGFYQKQNFRPCEYLNPLKGTLRMFRPLYMLK